MQKQPIKVDVHSLTSVKLRALWALAVMENESKDRFFATEIANFLTEECKIETSSHSVRVAFSRSRGLVHNTKAGFKLMEKGKRELLGLSQLKENGLSKEERVDIFEKYDLHPDIKSVSLNEFKDGYYKTSIQNALVEVIDKVKKKAGYPKDKNGRDMDGDALMQHVFGCTGNHEPLIKFNGLSSDLEKNEQQGLLYLYKGIVGIRNRKAHMNFVQNDPIKTLEYLSLASLLMRHLDDYKQDLIKI